MYRLVFAMVPTNVFFSSYFFHKNICCVFSFEAPQRGASIFVFCGKIRKKKYRYFSVENRALTESYDVL